jgi:hypothetical protein
MRDRGCYFKCFRLIFSRYYFHGRNKIVFLRYLTVSATCRKYYFSLTHYKENPILVFPEKELRGLSPNFHIHVSVSDLYILRIGPHIFLQAAAE